MSNEEKAQASDQHPARPAEGGGGMNTGVAIIGFILCFITGAGLMWGYDAHNGVGKRDSIAGDAAGGWNDDDSPVACDAKDPMWGNRSAPVTIVMWSDFQCPFCSRVEPTLQQIRDTYGPDKVRIIWKNEPLPFHPNAKPAAEAAQGVFAMAGNEAFWRFHDTAFKNQSALGTDSYVKWASDAGVKDIAKYKAGLDAHTWADKVDKDNAQGKSVGANGTPAFFINGVNLSGAQPFDKFKAVIDQELGKAQAKIASGTPKDKIYVAMSKDNKAAAPTAAAAPQPDQAPKDDTTTVFNVPVGTSPQEWSTKPLVTIVEFSDFQCPFCKRVEPSLKQIHDTYGDKVALVWKNEPLPFHNRAMPAAEVAMEALSEKGVKGFWEAHDKLFESQPKLEDADLEAVAKDLGLNVAKVDDAIKNNTWKKLIDDDNALSQTLQASGTPHFFINGRRLVGAQPFDKFKEIIDQEITKAQGLLSSGTAQKDLYATLMKAAKPAGAAPGGGGGDLEKKAMPSIAGAPWKGAKNAKVTIVQFSDFQCPFCSRVEPTVDQVMKDYGDKVKIVWRNYPLPFHQNAMPAAQAAMEAYKQKGSDGFWKMHDTLFKNQSALDRASLENYATQVGLDMTKFKSALDDATHKAEIDADQKMGQDSGVNGTPAFFINGYFVNGAQPYDKFKAAIDKALSEVK